MPRDLNVTIYWSSPDSFQYLVERGEHPRERLYAIVGRPPRSSTLSPVVFYIGQTTQHTADRIHNHHKYPTIEAEQSGDFDVKVRVGRIQPGANARVTDLLVADVEALLIQANRPAYNSRHETARQGTVATITNVTEKGAKLVDEIAGWPVSARRRPR